MKTVKVILFFISLGITLYMSYYFICVQYGTGPSYDWSMYFIFWFWVLSAVLFILCDLWLHHRIVRLTALGVLALVYLMSFEYYLFCEEYGHTIFQCTEKISLPSINDFSFYWSLQGLLVVYLLLAIGVSHLIRRRKKLLAKQINTRQYSSPND